MTIINITSMQHMRFSFHSYSSYSLFPCLINSCENVWSVRIQNAQKDFNRHKPQYDKR